MVNHCVVWGPLCSDLSPNQILFFPGVEWGEECEGEGEVGGGGRGRDTNCRPPPTSYQRSASFLINLITLLELFSISSVADLDLFLNIYSGQFFPYQDLVFTGFRPFLPDLDLF